MGIFAKLGGAGLDALKGINKGLDVVGKEAADWGMGLAIGSKSGVHLPTRRDEEDDNAYLTRVRLALNDARDNLRGRSDLGQAIELLDFGQNPTGRDLKLIEKFERLGPQQQLMIAESGTLNSMLGDTTFERGGFLNTFLPRPARSIIKGIPLIGEQAERIITPTVSPLGVMTAGLPGMSAGVMAKGTAGAIGAGMAGRQAENLGLNQKLKVGPITATGVAAGAAAVATRGASLRTAGVMAGAGLAAEQVVPGTPSLELGARSVGEIAGGLWGGGGAAVKRPTWQLDQVQTLIDDIQRAGNFADLTPNMQTKIIRLKMSVDNDTVAAHDYSARLQGDGLSEADSVTGSRFPKMPEETMDLVFEQAAGTPGTGYGALGNQAGAGSASWLPPQSRFIVNRGSRAAMLREGTPDWYALNAHLALESMVDGIQPGLAYITLLSERAGLGMRNVHTQSGLRQIAEKAGIVKESDIAARKVVAPRSDQPIANMPKGRNGMEPTAQNMHENPLQWPDRPQAVKDVAEAYDLFIEGVDRHVRSSMKNLGRTPKEIDAYLKKIKGGQGPYWHRLALDRDNNIMGGANAEGWGAIQPMQRERSLVQAITYLDSYTASAQAYASNAMRVLTNETIVWPMGQKLGVKVQDFVPGRFVYDLDLYKRNQTWITRAQKLADDANAGRSPKTIQRRAAELAQDPNAPQELVDLIYPLSRVDDEIMAAFEVNLGQKAKASARKTRGMATADEALFKKQQQAFKNKYDAWKAQNSKAVSQGDFAATRVDEALSQINVAVARLIKAAKADRAKLGRTAKKSAASLAATSKGVKGTTRPAGAPSRVATLEGSGTYQKAVNDLQELLASVDDVGLPSDINSILDDLVGAQGRILEAGERSRFAAAGGGSALSAEPSAAPAIRAGKARKVALEAGDEAVVAADVTAAGAAAEKTYRTGAREVGKTLKDAMRTNAQQRIFARNQIQQAKRYISHAQGFKMLDADKFPGYSAYRFQEDIGKQINEAFQKYKPTQGFVQGVNQFMALQHALVAGTADMGQLGLHLVPIFRPGTIKMLPRLIHDMFSEEATRRFIMESANRHSMDGTSMYTNTILGDLRNVVEAANPSIVMNNPGGFVKTVSGYLTNNPVNQVFSRGIRWVRQSQFEHNILLIEASTGVPITGKDLRIAAGNAEMITGDFNWTRAGISQTQRTTERTVMRFAPTWVRSQLKLIVSAATLRGGAEHMLARKALAAQLASYAGVYYVAALASGLDPIEAGTRLSPMNPDGTRNKDFLLIEVKGIKMGPGGVVLSVMRTAAKMADLSYKAAQGDEDAMIQLVNIKDTGQPLVGFWRAGAPILTGLIYDIVQGRESYGNRKLGVNPSEWENNAKSFAEGFEPFSISALREEGVLSGITQGFGGRAFPTSAPEKFLDVADVMAKEAGFDSWRDTPTATRKSLIRGDETLRALDDKRVEFYQRFPEGDDALFSEIDKSQGAMEDGLLASYAAVQAGAMTIPEFRQKFSDMQREHGYLANSLLDARDESPEQLKGEVKQDWYARLYTAIQPEQFDEDKDGVVDEIEFQEWRKAREDFWKDNPEAQNFRSYITVDYQAKKWKTPEMGAIALERYEALNLYEQFLKMPKYTGLTTSDGAFVDRARKAKNKFMDEARFNGQEPKSRQAWRQVMSEMGNLTGKELELFKVAIALDKRRVRDRLLNPQRVAFLQENLLLAEWYPSVIGMAGITVGERQEAGLPAPGGLSALDLVAQIG